MKKKVLAVILLTGVLTTACGYNKQVLDLDYSFTKAQIEGIGIIEIKSWKDYDNSDMIQVTGKDGTVYMTHSANVILMSK